MELKLRYSFLTRLRQVLGKELIAEEKLEKYIAEHKHMTLIERINAIRTDSNFIPDYNKPRAYTDIKIFDKNGVPIKGTVHTTAKRPIDFGNDVKAWKRVVQLDQKKVIKEQHKEQERQETQIQFKLLVETHYTPYIMKRMFETEENF